MNEDKERSIGALVDEAITGKLSKKYRDLSRRAFLSFLTRKAIAVAGVAVAAQALPFLVPVARAQVSTCGLDGRTCASPCTGGIAQDAWVACCQVGSGASCYFTCCFYTDLCQASLPSGCGSFGSGFPWCNGSSLYVCTVIECSGQYASQSLCQSDCVPNSGAGTFPC